MEMEVRQQQSHRFASGGGWPWTCVLYGTLPRDYARLGTVFALLRHGPSGKIARISCC